MVIHKVDTLFLDIGGVLLNDGWGIDSRQKAVEKFKLNAEEMNIRHEKCWDVLESGKMTMDNYLDEVIFYQSQSFSKSEFLNFIFSQSISLNGAFEYFIRLKKANGLRIFALNNEARELNAFRIRNYKLNELFDAYISSCYVGLRKPDEKIYKLACDISQTMPADAIFVDDRILNIEVAKNLGIPSLHYTGLESAKEYFEKAGFKNGSK